MGPGVGVGVAVGVRAEVGVDQEPGVGVGVGTALPRHRTPALTILKLEKVALEPSETFSWLAVGYLLMGTL